MSKKKIPTGGDSSGDGSAGRLPSHQIPLRRSPRLHPQKNPLRRSSRLHPQKNDDPNSKKQPQLQSSPFSPDSKQTQNKSSRSLRSRQILAAAKFDASQSRRRSPRLASISAKVTKKDADFSQSRRRSPRFSSDLAEVTRKDGDFVVKPSLSGRLMGSSKVAAKVAVDVLGYENSDGERDGGEKKRRRKRGENVEAEMETGRSEEEECCGFEGWTGQQEVALRRAYFSARPSPHFWKKVSQMVPGKTAQECFNRIHADLATPTQPQPRSRANRLNVSPVGSFTLSGSKMKELMETKTKRVRSRKQKSLIAQKTVRHLLRKHCLTDRSQEADHFSHLETSPEMLYLELPEIMSPETPDRITNPSSFLQKCNGRSSSSHKRMLSRFKTSQADPSPEVLKQIKNRVLHEKYIDHLHCRDVRRRTCTGTANPADDRCKKTSSELGIGALKAARTALISEARDYISHFQQMQANSLDNHGSFDSDDKNAGTDDYVDDGDE